MTDRTDGTDRTDRTGGTATPAVDPTDLRSCLGRFATGVTVVSYRADDGPRGATVNAFSSVSLDPPLVLVSIARTAKACALLTDRPFCVNVLSAAQVDLALAFAGRPRTATSVTSVTSVHWDDGEVAPRLRESHAWVECTPWRHYDGGDHVLYLGEVRRLAFRDGEPLLFYAGDFHSRARRPATAARPLHADALEQLCEEFVAGWL